MEKELFKEYSQSERVEMFESNADAVEDRTYFEKLSDEEMIEKKSQFAQKSIEIARIEDEKKSAIDEFKERLKPLSSESGTLLSEIKTGHTEKKGRIYKLVNREEGMVGYYSQNGDLIEQRPATREERSQLTIMSGRRKAVNE